MGIASNRILLRYNVETYTFNETAVTNLNDLLFFHKDSQSMREIGTSSIDLIVTSPPYWSIVNYGYPGQLGMGLTYHHFLLLLEKTLLECMRVIKEDSFVAFIVADIRTEAEYRGKGGRPRIHPLHSDIIQFFLKMDFDFFAHYFWRKNGINKPKGKIVYGSLGSGKYKGFAVPPFLYSDLLIEHVLVFRKPGKRKTLPFESRFCDSNNIIAIQDVRKWVDPIWVFDSPVSQLHPATCPREIVARLIKMHSMANDRILDPFMGSGTTCDVALALGRNAIGYEIHDDYINSFLQRYQELQEIDDKTYQALNVSSKLTGSFLHDTHPDILG